MHFSRVGTHTSSKKGKSVKDFGVGGRPSSTSSGREKMARDRAKGKNEEMHWQTHDKKELQAG